MRESSDSLFILSENNNWYSSNLVYCAIVYEDRKER